MKIAAGDPSKIVDDTQAAESADTAASGDVTVKVNGTSYTLSDFVEASVPAGFKKTTMNYEALTAQWLITRQMVFTLLI